MCQKTKKPLGEGRVHEAEHETPQVFRLFVVIVIVMPARIFFPKDA